jgi:hypothetical protein
MGLKSLKEVFDLDFPESRGGVTIDREDLLDYSKGVYTTEEYLSRRERVLSTELP